MDSFSAERATPPDAADWYFRCDIAFSAGIHAYCAASDAAALAPHAASQF